MTTTKLEIAAIQATAVLSLLLLFKVVVVNLNLGRAKMASGGRAKEDNWYQAREENAPPSAIEDKDRAQRMVNNDLENIPHGMIVAWASIFVISKVGDDDQKDTYAITQIVAYSFFVAARYTHSIVYSCGLSIPRSIAYLVGITCVFAISINAVIASYAIV